MIIYNPYLVAGTLNNSQDVIKSATIKRTYILTVNKANPV